MASPLAIVVCLSPIQANPRSLQLHFCTVTWKNGEELSSYEASTRLGPLPREEFRLMPGLAGPQFFADHPAPPVFHPRRLQPFPLLAGLLPISLLTRVTYGQRCNKSFIFRKGCRRSTPPAGTGRMPDKTDRGTLLTVCYFAIERRRAK